MSIASGRAVPERSAPSLLDDPEALPPRPADAVAAFGRTLVVAPHPDDESLGCGGALALLRERRIDVHVLFLSDGAGSHRNSRAYPPPALRALRSAEARAALAILGVDPVELTFLGLPDSAVPGPGAVGFEGAVGAVRAVLDAFRAETVLVPWRRDPHCDHRAAWHLTRAAIGATPTLGVPGVLEFPIWVYEWPDEENVPRAGEVAAWRLDVAGVLPKKRAAVAAHRSQTTRLIDDDPDGFRLEPHVLARFDRPWEIYLETLNEPT